MPEAPRKRHRSVARGAIATLEADRVRAQEMPEGPEKDRAMEQLQQEESTVIAKVTPNPPILAAHP